MLRKSCRSWRVPAVGDGDEGSSGSLRQAVFDGGIGEAGGGVTNPER